MGMVQFAQYSPKDVFSIVGGVLLDSGRSPDTDFISITKLEDNVVYKPSVDGDGTVSAVHNNYYEMTIVLRATSSGNAVLTGLYKLGRLNSKGFVVVPVLVVDKGSKGNLFASAEAWIKKWPDFAYAKESGDVSWVFGVHNPEVAIMGH